MADPSPTPPSAEVPYEQCYRHPDKRAGVRCQRCERPICPSCMVTASVGFHCPECVKASGTRVVRPGQLLHRPWVTQGLIAINVAVFVVQVLDGGGLWTGGPLVSDGAVSAHPIAVDHEWWRLVTAGFLHIGLLHVGFNMILLSLLGNMLEPRMGSARFALLYFTALLGGSLGAVLLSPNAATVGASGAVFGLMGAAVISTRRQGVNPWQTEIGMLLLFNLAFTFLVPHISVGGHVGGLAAGTVAGVLLLDAKGARAVLGVLATVLLAGGIVVASLAIASAA